MNQHWLHESPCQTSRAGGGAAGTSSGWWAGSTDTRLSSCWCPSRLSRCQGSGWAAGFPPSSFSSKRGRWQGQSPCSRAAAHGALDISCPLKTHHQGPSSPCEMKFLGKALDSDVFRDSGVGAQASAPHPHLVSCPPISHYPCAEPNLPARPPHTSLGTRGPRAHQSWTPSQAGQPSSLLQKGVQL